MNFFWGGRSKLAWIQAMLVSWMFLWGVFSLFVYPSLLPEAGGRDEYYAFAVDNKALHDKAETRDTSPLYIHRLDGIFLPLIQRSRTLQLSAGAVPARYRIPPSAGQNVTEYFMASPQHVAPHREYLFDYNPSIIRVHKNQVPEALAAEAVYLASFRVSNLNYCFHPEDRQRMVNQEKASPKDLLGLALLDLEWDILAETVVNVQSVMRGAQDFRLFASGSGSDATVGEQGEIYLNSLDLLMPLCLVVPPRGSDNKDVTMTAWTELDTVFEEQQRQSTTTTPGLRVWVAPKRTRCAPCSKPRSCGKNFHFFGDQNNSKLWAEVWPSAPHLIRRVSDDGCHRKHEPEQYLTEKAPDPSFENRDITTYKDKETTPLPNRRHAKAPSWLTRGRGSACCLKIQHPQTEKSLWMGIAHSKTLGGDDIQPNHYLSTLYAFEDKPPFALVAQSGYFCLPFPVGDDDSPSVTSPAGPMMNITRWRILRLGNGQGYPNCPRIHFVSGLVRDANDDDKVIVAYGLNDCVSRLVQVRLSDLMRLLFYRLPT